VLAQTLRQILYFLEEQDLLHNTIAADASAVYTAQPAQF
jgi:hypothetical protein